MIAIALYIITNTSVIVEFISIKMYNVSCFAN